MLASEHSTLDTLREVHAILRFYRFNREIDPRVAAPLRNLLTQESPPSWLQSDPARWAMLLEALATLNDVSLHQPISSAIARVGLPQKVQEAMLSYLRDTNATPSVTALEKSITTFDRASPMFVPTLQAVAHLSPSSAVLKEALAPMLAKGPATPAEAAALFVVASQLAVWSDGSTQTAQEAARSSVQFPALQRLVNSDYRLYVDHESVVIQTSTTKYGEGYKLPLGFMLEYGFGNSLVELLRKSTDVKDIRRVVDLATVRDSTRTNAIAVLRVTLGGSTTAAKNETNFTSGTLYLLTGEQGVDAHWLDLNGNPRSMPLPESLGQRVVGADIHARPDWLGRRSWAPAPSLFDDDRRLWLPSR